MISLSEERVSKTCIWHPQPFRVLLKRPTSVLPHSECLGNHHSQNYWAAKKEKGQGHSAYCMGLREVSQSWGFRERCGTCIQPLGIPVHCPRKRGKQLSASWTPLQGWEKVYNPAIFPLGERKGSRAYTHHLGILVHCPMEKGLVALSSWSSCVE